MIRGNTSDFIDHPLPKYFESAHGASHHAWTPGLPPSKSGAGVKCDCSVQRIGTNTNNLTASKHATICCKIFCIFRETGTCIFAAEPQPFQSRVRHFSCRALQSYNSPGDWGRELFKPSTDSASLVVKIEKKIFVLGLSFSGGNVTSMDVFALFWPSFPGPVRRPNGQFLDSKFSWKLGQNPRL